MGPRNFSEFATNEAGASESTAQVNRSGSVNGLTGKGYETARFYHPHMGLTQYSYKNNLKNQRILGIWDKKDKRMRKMQQIDPICMNHS